MNSRALGEAELERIEASGTVDAIPELVRAIRDYQRELDSLRLKAEVARRDRDELRAALVSCREELRRSGG